MTGPGAVIPPFQSLLLIQVSRSLLSLPWTQPLHLLIPPSKAPFFCFSHKVVGAAAASSPSAPPSSLSPEPLLGAVAAPPVPPRVPKNFPVGDSQGS